MNIELAEIVPMLCTDRPNKKPPLTIEQLQAFETALECSLPEDVKQLYLEHDGHEPQKNHSMFLMPSDDVLKVHNDIKRRESWWWIFPNLTDHIRYLWHDEDGNFAGLYVTGPLVGKIVFNDHEVPSPAPVFRSVIGFYRANLEMLKATIWDWENMPTDYPAIGEISTEDSASDLAIVLTCLNNWKNARDLDEKKGWASCIIALTPPEETTQLLTYIDANGFDRSKILDVIAKRRCEPAIKQLTTWLLNDLTFTQRDIFYALGSIAGEGAADLIQNLIPEITRVAKGSAMMTLLKLGYKIRKTDNHDEYLPPKETTWRKL